MTLGVKPEKGYEELVEKFGKEAKRLKVPPSIACDFRRKHKGKCKFMVANGIVAVIARRELKRFMPLSSIKK